MRLRRYKYIVYHDNLVLGLTNSMGLDDNMLELKEVKDNLVQNFYFTDRETKAQKGVSHSHSTSL